MRPLALHPDALAASDVACEAGGFELRFVSLFREGRALSFPCDEAGHVFVDRLSRRALTNYLYARAGVGREYDVPVVVPVCVAAA